MRFCATSSCKGAMVMFPRSEVLPIANGLVGTMRPGCEKIEIAGSLRRGKDQVKDIEIVAQPILGCDIFGDSSPDVPSGLDAVLMVLIARGRLDPVKGGQRYMQFVIRPEDIKLDLFIVRPPAQWGPIFLIRTGPDSFSKRFVTKRKYGGLLPSNLREKDGCIWDGDRALDTPTEESVFSILGIPWIPPEERN